MNDWEMLENYFRLKAKINLIEIGFYLVLLLLMYLISKAIDIYIEKKKLKDKE